MGSPRSQLADDQAANGAINIRVDDFLEENDDFNPLKRLIMGQEC